ncbi:MAG: queuosine precursor transporter [Parasphingorhabdus sp.]|uniref:queuosine precursor transporter n=1 Tax=Parasphingorhabdus sp. TaxID=2709688 RepID=UPI003296FDE7
MTAISETKHIPRGLFVISVLYGGMASLAGILGNKLVALGPLAVEAGIFAFILLVVLAGAVAEVYGRAVGNRIVVFGFVPIIVSMILIQLVLALPPASFWEEEKRVAFDIILNQSTRLMFAGIIAYGTSQLLNVFIITRLRGEGGKMLWLRSMVAGVVSQAVDTVIFITVAFYDVAPLMKIMPGQLLAKVILSAVLVPPLIYGIVRMAKRLDAE